MNKIEYNNGSNLINEISLNPLCIKVITEKT